MTQPSRIQYVVANYRHQLLAHEATASHVLEKAHAHTLTTIKPYLDKLYKEIASEQEISPSFLHEHSRLNIVKKHITSQIGIFAALALTQAKHLQHISASLGQQSAQSLLQASKPAGINHKFASITAMPQHDISHLFNGYGEEAANKVAKVLILAISLGWIVSRIASMVDDVLGISRNRALITLTNESARAYKSSQFATYQANDNIVIGWVWICSFDHSCIACIAMHGSKHKLDEELQDHINGHCSAAPLTQWSPNIKSGSDWFDSQDDSVQQAAFSSKAAYQAYKRGDFSLDDVVKQQYNPGYGRSIVQKPLKVLVK